MNQRTFPVEVLWCPNARKGNSNLWSFPPAVNKFLQAECSDGTALQLFGGCAKWGTRLDIDKNTRPHVIGDAFLPPFGRDSFDYVIIDPPYTHINCTLKTWLLRGAAMVARKRVYWFHTLWISTHPMLKLERAYLIRVGDHCVVRCLQVYGVKSDKPSSWPAPHFRRGPAIKYNRWIVQPESLPFGKAV